MAEPSREQWQALYAAAAQFRDLAPWAWMTNEHLFAVEDPETDENGYCSVMGAAGEEFGLAVFLGAEGFTTFLRLMREEIGSESLDTLLHLRSASVTFVDREFLERPDHEVIRSLGLRFRGRGAWPWFRSQRPGYTPWFLDADEARMLEFALRQAVDVAQRARSGTLRLTSGVDNRPVLLRRLVKDAWVDDWRQPPTWKPPQEAPPVIDEVRLQRLRTAKSKGRAVWQLDFFLIPTPLGERGERPYLPLMFLAADQQGMIVGTDLLLPWASTTERAEAVLKAIENTPILPREIRLSREEVRRLVTPVAAGLGIATRIASLRELEALKDDMVDHLGGA